MNPNTHSAATPKGQPTKTIGNARAAGETRFTVHCGRIECGHRAELAFDKIKLPDETIFVHIPRLLNFICSKCGSRDVKECRSFRRLGGSPDRG
jgi:phage terminase large subunit GpA-like protein